MPRTFIFDMDGVLWDSWLAHESAFIETLATVGVHDFNYAKYAGMRTDDVIAAELRRCGLFEDQEDNQAALVRLKQGKALARLQTDPPVVPATRAVLAAAARRGLVGLATSASSRTLELFLKASGVRPMLGAIVSGEQVARAKPAPDIYQLAAQRLGSFPTDCWVIEDAPHGVTAARAASMSAIGIAAHVPKAELLAAGAEVALARLSDLIVWMEERFPVA